VKLYNLKKKKFFKKLVLTPHEARSLTSPKLLLFFKKRAELTFLKKISYDLLYITPPTFYVAWDIGNSVLRTTLLIG